MIVYRLPADYLVPQLRGLLYLLQHEVQVPCRETRERRVMCMCWLARRQWALVAQRSYVVLYGFVVFPLGIALSGLYFCCIFFVLYISRLFGIIH